MCKKHRLIFLLLLILSGFFVLFIIWNSQKTNSDELLANNVEFSGKIVGLKVSNNHLFSIITIKIDSTTTKEFLPSGTQTYPYRIKDSVAEIYHYTSTYLQKGTRVKLNSNQKKIRFYNRNSFMYELDMWIITEKENIEFIKNNTSIR